LEENNQKGFEICIYLTLNTKYPLGRQTHKCRSPSSTTTTTISYEILPSIRRPRSKTMLLHRENSDFPSKLKIFLEIEPHFFSFKMFSMCLNYVELAHKIQFSQKVHNT